MERLWAVYRGERLVFAYAPEPGLVALAPRDTAPLEAVVRGKIFLVDAQAELRAILAAAADPDDLGRRLLAAGFELQLTPAQALPRI